MKKYLFILFAAVVLASCAGDGEKSKVPVNDSTRHADSMRQKEEDEMTEEVIKESFDALNR